MRKYGQMETTELSSTAPKLSKPKRFPVSEIFGPTIQGEGIDQGTPCHFIRFGGCDYKCDWCDTPHAVLPHLVRQADRLTLDEIVLRVHALTPGPRWIVVSGGNPVLHELRELVRELHHDGFLVSVETQGTLWKQWLWSCDRVAVSPKPPSSGHTTDWVRLSEFMRKSQRSIPGTFLKVVCFDATDYNYAVTVHRRFPEFPMFLSAGNDAGATVGNPSRIDTRDYGLIIGDLVRRGRWLANRTMVDPDMFDVRVQMQQHVLYWGNERGK
jgi:7-carboxy-7-deazaguanine synthase